MELFRSLSRASRNGNASRDHADHERLATGAFAGELASCGVRRVNVSLDTLDPARLQGDHPARRSRPRARGIDAAQRAGLAVKINVVALKGVNEDEFEPMVRWAHARNMAITFIEVMPLGEIETSRFDQHLPLTKVRGNWLGISPWTRPTIALADPPAMCG